MARNFNVGDVVINLENLKFWDNVYHHKLASNTMNKRVVVAVTDKYFTLSDKIDIERASGLSDWGVQNETFYQSNGRCLGSSSASYVNWTTNEKNVRAYIQGVFDKGFEDCDKEDADTIAKLEAEILAKQAQIEKIKAGKRPVSFQHDVVEREFLQASVDTINKLLDA